MSLLQRASRDVVRSSTIGPLSLRDPQLARLLSDRPRSLAGPVVNEVTALNVSAVWAAVNLIASHVGSLPLILYRRLAGGGKERATAHPLYTLLRDAPNPEMTAVTFREVEQAHILTWGNAYAEIERNGTGRPIALWPLAPDRVTPTRDTRGDLVYRVRNPQGADVILPSRDVFHVPGLGFDGVLGYSVIQKARESIGLGIAAEQFGATFYGNGSNLGGVLTTAENLDEEQQNAVRAMVESHHRGVDQAHRFLILSNGFKYEKLGIPPEQGQFLGTRLFQVQEIARWFNVPVHKLQDLSRATFSNVEHMALEFVTDSLMPWLVRWEQEIARKLLTREERRELFAEFLVDGLLRGDAASRGDYYSKLWYMGAISMNEIRARENLNPIPGGDEHFVSTNAQPLSRAMKEPAPAPVPNDLTPRSWERDSLPRLALRSAEFREPYDED